MSNFPAARLKIDRAYSHISEMQALVDWYCVPELHPPVFENDPATGCTKVRLQSEPIPPHTSLIFGDVIHCLRSAFDHAAYALTTGKAQKEFISFPFGKTLADLRAIIKGGQIKVAGAEAIKVIVHEIRPYLIDSDTGEKGNVALWMLNKLDNIDKHRELLVTIGHITTHVEDLVYPPSHNVIFRGNTFITPSGYLGDIIPPIAPVIRGRGTTTVQISIGEPDFFYQEPIIPTLTKLAELTTGAIDILEPFG